MDGGGGQTRGEHQVHVAGKLAAVALEVQEVGDAPAAYKVTITTVADRPGMLSSLTKVLADHEANFFNSSESFPSFAVTSPTFTPSFCTVCPRGAGRASARSRSSSSRGRKFSSFNPNESPMPARIRAQSKTPLQKSGEAGRGRRLINLKKWSP